MDLRADDLMENDDLAPNSADLGELPPPVGQQALIDQNGQVNLALLVLVLAQLPVSIWLVRGTISAASTWLTVKPYFRQCAPPEFSATLPPIEQICWLDGSGA